MNTHIQNGNIPTVEPVAIIGMAFRFPGGNNTTASFWEFIRSAKVAISDTPPDRFDIDAYHSSDPGESGTTYSRRAGYVDDPFGFDAEFFRISAAEALEMDPQQRWMLQLCWSALEHAGIVPSELSGRRVGLFLTAGDVDYARRTVASGDLHRITAYGKLGANRAVGVGRVAFTLGLQGPAISLDSTCSSSLVAVHLAAQSLRCGDCDLAIAGGTNLILGPEETIGFARLQAMSRSDTCRTFDSSADGYIRGEGGAVVVLKRAREATADKDRIEALLVGSSINNDGASNGLTAPNGAAQEAVIRQALAHARAKPEDVVYVETHGTGTPLGDPIELAALRNAYTQDTVRSSPLLLGALKAQIGHLEVAAGIAGLIKAILVLRHRQAPPQASFETPNPRFRWEGAQMEVPRAGRELPGDGHLVAVSSFGISGTNAHALLAPPPSIKPVPQPDRMRVLTISARSHSALKTLAAAYLEPVTRTDMGLRDLCYTASIRREHWDHRLALVAETQMEMAEALREFGSGVPSGRWHIDGAAKRSRLVFLFPGQGSWRPGSGAILYRDNPIFRSAVDDCLGRLASDVATEVHKAILDSDPRRARHDPGQLAHFVVLHSLARTWIRLGVKPDVVIGHSLGEHVAAVIAGVMSLDDGLKAVEARGRLFEERRQPGAMLAVSTGAEWIEATLVLGTDLFVAAINGSEQTVLSGTVAAIAGAEKLLANRGLRVTQVQTYDTPAHCPLLTPLLAPFRQALSSIRLQAPEIELISTVTGRRAGQDIAGIDHWVALIERPVQFQAALQTATEENVTFLEVGPGTTLSNLAKAASGDTQRAISSLCDGPDGSETAEPDGFAHACARLYCAGHSPDWRRLYGSPPPPAEAPTYAFDLKHVEIPASKRNPASVVARLDPVFPNSLGAADRNIGIPDIAGTVPTEDVRAAVIEAIRPVVGEARELNEEAALVTMGFDSLAIMAMRAGLQRRFGRALPMSILAGASLRSIAAFYARGNTATTGTDNAIHEAATGPLSIGQQAIASASDTSPVEALGDLVVTLREGTGPVVALIHPVGGDVMCYGELAAAWTGDARIVGVRHPDANMEGMVRYRSHAQLAQLYRRALVAAIGRAPDILGGWSFGGTVAQEIALQWEEEGISISALVIIDSPLPDGGHISRARRLVEDVDTLEAGDFLGQVVAHSGFQTIFDEQHGLDRLREIADSATVDHLYRIHAANVATLARHRPRIVRTPIWYALALRAGNARNREEALERLGALSSGSSHILGFDCDHFSIMRSGTVEAVAGFLGMASKPLDRSFQFVAQYEQR